jgi:hypothetical protein
MRQSVTLKKNRWPLSNGWETVQPRRFELREVMRMEGQGDEESDAVVAIFDEINHVTWSRFYPV